MVSFKFIVRTFLGVVSLVYSAKYTQGCTRVLWSDNGQCVLVGRTMDWGDSTEPELWVFPRGLHREGQIRINPLRWQSKYGSLVTSAYGEVTVDGINEAGLSGHILYLKETSYGLQRSDEEAMTSGICLQYILDNYASVDEAVTDAKNWSIVLGRVKGHEVKIHIAIEDSSGDSAIFEYINKKLESYHSKDYRVLTNSPAYNLQLKQAANCSGQKNAFLSVEMKSSERFCLASSLLMKLPQPTTPTNAISAIMSIMRTLSIPFTPTNNTFYRTVINVTDGLYFFDNAIGLNLLWVNLSQVDFGRGATIKHLNPMNPQFSGDVSQEFSPYSTIPY